VNSNLPIFIVKRAINAVITLLVIITIIFLLIHLIAPSATALAKIYAPPKASRALINQIIIKYNLNAPLYVQVFSYISNVFHGNLGYDPVAGAPEITLIGEYLPITLELVIPATILAVILGLLSGVFAASKKNKPGDYAVKGIYLLTWASPPFLVATFLQLVVGYDLGLLPAIGMVNPTLVPPKNVAFFPLLNALIAGDFTYFISLIHHMILPIIALALISFGIITRITRSSMINAIDSDYFKLSLMKGMTRNRALYGVALRNASLPLVTLIALLFGFSVAGAVIIEDIFQYHGMGYFIVQAIYNTDYIAILDTTLIIAISIIIANLVADILYGVLDPRVRVE
jgi:ABC-type dipeptide/oligopeptide/nickel transport system permease component